MYESIKKIIVKVVPKKIIQNNEKLIRKVIALKYRGTKFQCNLCHYNLEKFITLKNGDEICPSCGSVPRTRRLWNIINNNLNTENKVILHFSPPKTLKALLEKKESITYVSSDFEGEFTATKKLNITEIEEPNDTYDIIICYHILEHITNDNLAIKELYRILKPNGICIIQTPFKSGDTYEDFSINTDEGRRIHFGQKDHVRIYSVSGLTQKLSAVGFTPKINQFDSNKENQNGFKQNETVIFATK